MPATSSTSLLSLHLTPMTQDNVLVVFLYANWGSVNVSQFSYKIRPGASKIYSAKKIQNLI